MDNKKKKKRPDQDNVKKKNRTAQPRQIRSTPWRVPSFIHSTGVAVRTTAAGIEVDPFEADLAEQELLKRDHADFRVDARMCYTWSQVTAGGTEEKAMRASWRFPTVYTDGANSNYDSRGIATGIKAVRVTIKNLLTSDSIHVKGSAPLSSASVPTFVGGRPGVSPYKALSRTGTFDRDIKPGGTYRNRVAYDDPSNLFVPTLVDIQGKALDKYYPHMVMLDLAFIMPDILNTTGVAPASEQEIAKVTFEVEYHATYQAVQSSTVQVVTPVVLTKLGQLAEVGWITGIGVGSESNVIYPTPKAGRAIGWQFRNFGGKNVCTLVGIDGKPLEFDHKIDGLLRAPFGPIRGTSSERNWDYVCFQCNIFKYLAPLKTFACYNPNTAEFFDFPILPKMDSTIVWPAQTSFTEVAEGSVGERVAFSAILAILEVTVEIVKILQGLGSK